jgi:hypothetical protein
MDGDAAGTAGARQWFIPKIWEFVMAGKLDSASQKITPRDAQKGGQGALSKERPDIALREDAPRTDDAPIQNSLVSEELTATQIALMCEIERRDASKLTRDKSRDLVELLSKGYIESLDGPEPGSALGPHFALTAKGIDFLGKRGVGLNEA